jgi:hypothetical protein
VVLSDERDKTVSQGTRERGVAFFVAVAEEAVEAVPGVSVLCDEWEKRRENLH